MLCLTLQTVKKVPQRPLFLYMEEEGAKPWNSGEKMRGRSQ